MPQEICPSLFSIVPGKKTEPDNTNDVFRSDGFKVLQAESLTRIKHIIAQELPLRVRLLCCYRVKDLEETYCVFRRVDNPKKQICSGESGIKTDFIHFHIQGEKTLRCSNYLLAFIEGSDLSNNVETLVKELLSSIAWLEIEAPDIILNVFTFGQPVFGTRNLEHSLVEFLNTVKTQVPPKYKGTIDFEIHHINKEENRLSVSLKNGFLCFTPS
jgi:hypothetical protein